MVVDLPAELTVEKKFGSTKVACFICGELETIVRMRNHIGQHVLYELCNIPDPMPQKIKVSLMLLSYPCTYISCTHRLASSHADGADMMANVLRSV